MRRALAVLAVVVPVFLAGPGAQAVTYDPWTQICVRPMLPDAFESLEGPYCVSAPIPSELPVPIPLPF